MKFSATFAVLAVFVSNAVVSAAPFRGYETDALEARAEFVVRPTSYLLFHFI